tara:strand:- start:628 stop:900 length:273 start_codon:yes stop_codon:yes gene_type:complete
MEYLMHWYTRFWERFAIGILVRSKKISMLAFKDVDLDQIIMTASASDPIAVAFVVNNDFHGNFSDDDGDCDPDSIMLERLFHSPDANKKP